MNKSKQECEQVYLDYIDEQLIDGKNWDEITRMLNWSEDELPIILKFVGRRSGLSDEEILSVAEWYRLVERKKRIFKEEQDLKSDRDKALIARGSTNNFTLSDSKGSMWKTYLRNLQRKNMSKASIKNITESTKDILTQLNPETECSHPFKGLVVGNVQSGKTANMGALISAAADNGFNMFIILSGMIESLRVQTEERFKKDLNNGNSSSRWNIITNPAPSGPDPLVNCIFTENPNMKYLTVVLKNATRLNNLIGWLKSDPNKLAQMKILIIDDESDQASINTKDIESGEATTIHRLIKQLVFSSYWRDDQVRVCPKAVNYIGYSATPQANILNESGPDSLFPDDMVYSLPVSAEYFGPQQIFGFADNYSPEDQNLEQTIDGLNIVRIIPQDQIFQIEEDQNGKSSVLPETFKDSVCWFLSSVAALRSENVHRPFSMLVHTSQKTYCHEEIGRLVADWLQNIPKATLIDRCRKVWEKETSEFTLCELKNVMVGYPDGNLNDYPPFEGLRSELELLIDENIQFINLDEDRIPHYGNGIHLCIDNSKNNPALDDVRMMRLLYPNSSNMPSKAPAFLVIGGMTLSRGLTLEGLISTYFLRTTKLGDSLMQMGRWFGYRKGYELYPRIWMSEDSVRRFEALSVIDYELREKIRDMDRKASIPGQTGIPVKLFPSRLLRLTSKNKMQSAKAAGHNFSGLDTQTKFFDSDQCVQKANLKLTENFLKSLGQPTSDSVTYVGNGKVWTEVPASKVCDYLSQYKFQKNMKLSSRIPDLIKWIRKESREGRLKNWSVILPQNKNSKLFWGSQPYRIRMVNRSRLANSKDPDVINIGAVKTPDHSLADLRKTREFLEFRKKYPGSKPFDIRMVREHFGMTQTPQLIIYIIDKNSRPTTKASKHSRYPLNSKENLVGLAITVPGERKQSDYADYLIVQLNDEEVDIVEED